MSPFLATYHISAPKIQGYQKGALILETARLLATEVRSSSCCNSSGFRVLGFGVWGLGFRTVEA